MTTTNVVNNFSICGKDFFERMKLNDLASICKDWVIEISSAEEDFEASLEKAVQNEEFVTALRKYVKEYQSIIREIKVLYVTDKYHVCMNHEAQVLAKVLR